MQFRFFISYFIIFLTSSLARAQNWYQINDFPGTQRDDGASFTIGPKSYCGTGQTPWWTGLSDFYAIDLTTDNWTEVAGLPTGEQRQYASGFSSSTYGFIFGGYDDGNFLNDLWRYNPTGDIWTEMAALPDSGRSGCASFVIGDKAYIIGGKTNQNFAIDEVWEYDLGLDEWNQLLNFPYDSIWRAAGNVHNGLGYIAFGRNNNDVFKNQLYSYAPSTDSWTELSTFPSIGRSHSAMLSLEQDLFVIAGYDSTDLYHNDLWQYNISSDTWNQLNAIPSNGRRGGIAFNSSVSIYYSTGLNDFGERLKETWKCPLPTGVSDLKTTSPITLFPNPVKSWLTIEHSNAIDSIYVMDMSGRVVLLQVANSEKTIIDVTHLNAGNYWLKVNSEGTPVPFVKN